jgi:protein-L-isoaspartate O-methyltransferase
MKSRPFTRLAPALLFIGLAPAVWSQAPAIQPNRLAPYVPSPAPVVHRMLSLAGVSGKDTVYDLGSGDGRIVIMAAERFGAKAVGVEIDEELVMKARDRVKELRLENRVQIVQQDLMDVDLSPASVVTLYLLWTSNKKIKPNLEASLKAGTRVVSHDFQIEGWTPIQTEKLRGEGRNHTIYLYEVGKQ